MKEKKPYECIILRSNKKDPRVEKYSTHKQHQLLNRLKDPHPDPLPRRGQKNLVRKPVSGESESCAFHSPPPMSVSECREGDYRGWVFLLFRKMNDRKEAL
jgi:hypothetical protein